MLRRLIVALRPALGLALLLMGGFNRGLARGRVGVAYETCTHGRNIRQRSRAQRRSDRECCLTFCMLSTVLVSAGNGGRAEGASTRPPLPSLTESATRMVIRVVLGAESLLVKNNGV